MDLGLYMRVLWRFRLLVGLGAIVALGLALLSVVRVSEGFRVTFREPTVWQANAKLLISQPGFPEGRAVPGYTTAEEGGPPLPSTDPVRLQNLAYLYAEIANGDEVRTRFRRLPGPNGPFFAQAYTVMTPQSYSQALPMLVILGNGGTRQEAGAVTRKAARAFNEYLTARQTASNIHESERVVTSLLRRPGELAQVGGPSKSIPVVVFLTVMLATIGLALVLENLNPRIRVVRELEPEARQTRRRA